MFRRVTCLLAAGFLLAGCGGVTGSSALPAASTAAASPTEAASTDPSLDGAVPPGRIAFMRGDPSEGVFAGAGVIYTVNADGSDLQELFSEDGSAGPTWSPDGTDIQVFCCDDGMIAHFVDPATGELVRTLSPPPDPSLEVFCGGSWSPDGKRLSCEGFGVDDPSLNGAYTIRTSDGGDLQGITSNPGGFDAPGDFSPDGGRLVFTRFVDEQPVGVFVTDLDGSGLVQISPPDLVLDDTGFGGSWSPDGSQILFVGQLAEEPAQGNLDRRFGRQLGAPLRDDTGVRWQLLGPLVRWMLLAGVVARWLDDRVHAVELGRGDREHLHREGRRDGAAAGN